MSTLIFAVKIVAVLLALVALYVVVGIGAVLLTLSLLARARRDVR